MSAELDTLLRQGLTDIGLPLGEEQIANLLAHQALIAKWTRVYNLTALRDPREMLTHHLLDCLAAIPALRRRLGDAPQQVLDVGAGAGLPGVAWAIVQPHWQVTCVDAVAKKATFIRQVAAELALPNLRAEHARVEDLRPLPWTLITSRAFASLPDFVSLTRPLLAPGGWWAAMKGRAPDDERAGLPDDIVVDAVEPLTVPRLEAERCLVWMRRA